MKDLRFLIIAVVLLAICVGCRNSDRVVPKPTATPVAAKTKIGSLASDAVCAYLKKADDIEHKEFPDTGTLLGAMQSGQIAGACIDPHRVNSEAQPTGFHSAAPKIAADFALVMRDGEITNLFEIKGRFIGVPNKTSAEAEFLNTYLRKHQLDGSTYVVERSAEDLRSGFANRYLDGIVIPRGEAETLAQQENTGIFAVSQEITPDLVGRVLLLRTDAPEMNHLTKAATGAGLRVLDE